MASSSSEALLRALVPGERALVVPLTMDGYSPGLPPYEALVGELRAPGVRIFGLALPFGVLSEEAIRRHPEILRVGANAAEHRARREAKVRIRAWMDTEGARFGRIVLLTYGPMMPVWSDAVRGSASSRRVQLVQVHRGSGLRDTILRKRLARAVRG